MTSLRLQRLGQLMEPEADNPLEAEGILNPAAARGPDGQLYLFPRLVARGNYSRIGIARVRFNAAGDPVGAERLGIALEPEADYELCAGGGGCEDPRITFVEPLRRYVMTYTALSPDGPRIAVALSEDLFHWQRLELAGFLPSGAVVFDNVDDKDASVFPRAIAEPDGKPALAMLHRPLFSGTRPEQTACQPGSRVVDVDRESIWISDCPMGPLNGEPFQLGTFGAHHRLASPAASWERLKIGAGTPPVMSRHGWLPVYHGVSEVAGGSAKGHALSYAAGVMVLARAHPRVIRYRSVEPVLVPTLPQERRGTVANVVFPTGIDRREDLGLPDRFDVYYGMADNRIGVARLDMPEFLPSEGLADPPNATV
ncbi:MAG: glycosidase [Gammaproteobacteria bacterium]